MSLEFLRNLPIKRKLLVLTLSACGIILLLACAGLFAFQAYIFKKTFARDLKTLAAVVAANATGPVTFGDQKAAEEILSALSAEEQVVGARIELADGSMLAETGAKGKSGTSAWPKEPGYHGSELLVAQSIQLKGQTLGTLAIRANFRKTYMDLVGLYAGILALVLGGSVGVALLVSTRLQRFITEPVSNLTETARSIAERRDYSVRAKKMSKDEFGLLTDAFNQMLGQIETQDAAVRDSEGRYRLLFESSPVPMYVFDMETQRFLAVNASAVEHYGYSHREFLDMTLQFLLPVDAPASDGPGQRPGETRVPWGVRHCKKDGAIIHVELTSHQIEFEGRRARLVLALDVTQRKRNEEELASLNRQLLETSRQAGMAEVANSVLHNVGNVLNSVNVSAGLVVEQLRKSKTVSLAKAVELLCAHHDDVGEFLANDPKGKQLPAFFQALSEQLTREQAMLTKETQSLQQNIEHIKQIVAMQQSYAKVSGARENLSPHELVEDALRMTSTALARHQIEVVRQFDAVPPALVDRHMVLQILVNLISNAKQAMDARPEGRQLVLRIARGNGEHVRVEVTDNGVGVPPENLARIFNHGFTTKKSGHGFGLHSGANAAKEMGGSLNVHSDGQGAGATFILELPLSENAAHPSAPPTDKPHMRINRAAA